MANPEPPRLVDYETSEEEDHLSDIMIKHWEEDLNKGRFPAYPYPSARICTTVSELMGLGEDEDTDSGTENSGEEDEMTLSDIMIKHWEENFEEGMSFPHTLPLSLRICTTVSELMSLDVDEDTDSGTTESRETHGTDASLDGIIDFDINNAPESDSSAYNSDDPQRKEKALERMWKRQTRSDYLNVIPNHRVRGGKPNPVDRRFRDVRNNILNSGQIFQFTELRYRWFLDHTNTPPIPVPGAPVPTSYVQEEQLYVSPQDRGRTHIGQSRPQKDENEANEERRRQSICDDPCKERQI
jgi:hypothetical protein